jgi:hypothetical protein
MSSWGQSCGFFKLGFASCALEPDLLPQLQPQLTTLGQDSSKQTGRGELRTTLTVHSPNDHHSLGKLFLVHLFFLPAN